MDEQDRAAAGEPHQQAILPEAAAVVHEGQPDDGEHHSTDMCRACSTMRRCNYHLACTDTCLAPITWG
jgi:hypothetical protein